MASANKVSLHPKTPDSESVAPQVLGGYSRLAYTEALPNETARTAIAFTHRARAFFTAHGITHVHRIITENGACYRAHDFAHVLRGARHQRITPYTPRHDGNPNAPNAS